MIRRRAARWLLLSSAVTVLFGCQAGDRSTTTPKASSTPAFAVAAPFLAGPRETAPPDTVAAARIETSAACTVEKVGDAFAVTTMALTVRVSAAGIENDAFQALAAATKDGCPISKAIKGNVNITLDAQLV